MSKRAFNSITFLRGLACIGVLWYHVQYPGVNIPKVFNHDIGWLSFYGSISVWIFFIVSGYVIGMGFFTKRYQCSAFGILTYVWKRFWKIAPLYYATILIAYIAYKDFPIFQPDNVWKLITFTGTDLVNTFGIGYLWYISAQMQLYLLAPILYFALHLLTYTRPYQRFFIILLIPLVGLVYRSAIFSSIYPGSPSDYVAQIYAPTKMNLDLFTFGIGLNLLPVFFVKRSRLVASIALLVLLVVSNWINYQADNDFFNYRYIFGAMLPVFVTYVIGLFIVSFNSSGTVSAIRKIKPVMLWPAVLITFIGTVSYEIYLVQDIVIFKLRQTCQDGCTVTTLIIKEAIVLGISFVIAVLIQNASLHSRRWFRRLFLQRLHGIRL